MALARWEVEAWMQPGEMLDPRGLFPLRPAWMAQGACRGSDINFFTGRGESTEPAKRLCLDECPVREQCLSYALADRELAGVWGGTSDRERRRMRKEQGLRTWKVTPRRTECAKGHSYNHDNTYVTPQGHRQCRICRVEYMRNVRSKGKDQLPSATVGCKSPYDSLMATERERESLPCRATAFDAYDGDVRG